MAVLRFPAESRSLPGPADLENLLTLPLTQLIVCGRSGSMFLHALLDGHPEILQIPHTFKFYDYLASFPDFSVQDGQSLARAFVEAPAHEVLFDSDASVLLRGRVGAALDTRVLIDRKAFSDAMASTLPGAGHDARRILCAILLAHAWCTSKPVDCIKQLFVHVHHGDWLWPETIEERCNLQGIANSEGLRWLAPDHLIITVRNPADQIRSMEHFIPKAETDTTKYGLLMESYLRLLVQDWLRIELAQASGLNVKVIKLENLRMDLPGELQNLTAWMGVRYSAAVLTSPTAFGMPWWGDIYSNLSLTMNPSESIQTPDMDHADHQFLYALTDPVVASQGYPSMPKAKCHFLLKWLPAQEPERSWPKPTGCWRRALRDRGSYLRAQQHRHTRSLVDARDYLSQQPTRSSQYAR
jgi:hypothetical protein